MDREAPDGVRVAETEWCAVRECAAETHPDDAQLVAAARRDPSAFTALYRRYVGRVYQYLRQEAADHHDAEDLTAATFGKALASLPRYEEQGRFAAWLFSIARHTVRDHHRRRRRAHADLENLASEPIDPAPSAETVLIEAERARALRRLIAALPAEQREAVILRFFGRLRSAEVATVLGKSDGATRMLIHRALIRLRQAYREEEEA